LVIESDPKEKYGYLSTNNPYKNLILDLHSWLEANENSGVFTCSHVDDDDGITIHG
jgi:hypothetical protein